MTVTTVTKMEVRSEMTDVILNITLEIIHLLTGEDYTVVNKKSGEHVTSSSYPNISGGWSRTRKPIMEEPPSQSVVNEKNNQKILELANKIIELLTGEVPIRCQDVTVHFSMEEWEYLEGHKELYKDVIMENHQKLTSAGCLHDNTSSHEQVTCFSSQSNHFSWSHLGNELKKTTQNVTICDGESLKDISNYAPTKRVQYPSTHIMEETISSNGGTFTDPNMYTPTDGNKQYISTHIIEEAVSCDDENLTKPDIYMPSEPIQHDPFLYIKEEAVSGDEDLSEHNSYTPTDHLQYSSPHIKEEPVSCDEDLSEPNSYTPADHLQYPSPQIKEEPVSRDGDLIEPNIYMTTDHLQYLSHVKEEPVSCDYSNRYTPTNYTPQHQFAYIKMEPNSHIGGNFNHPDIYTAKDHAQYPTTHLKEDPVSCDGRNITHPDSYTLIDHIQQLPNTHIKEESVPSDVRDLIDPKIYHAQYQSTHIKEEPVSCRGNAKYQFAQPQKEPITSQLGYLKETDLYTTTDHKKNFLSSCVKDEIAVQHSPTLGYTDLKTENPSSPMKVIVLAHLVDIDPNKPSSTNKYWNSQKEGFASTSSRVRHDRLFLRNHSSSLKTPEAGQTFGDISNLTKYSRIHSRKKTPQCPECGQYFLRKLQLEDHIEMHTKQKSLQCSDCGKYFLDNVQLLDRKKDPGQSTYKCPVCRKRLDNEQNHLTGQKNLKAEKPFQCPECGKCFSIYYELFIHKKNHMEDSKK